MSDGLPTRAATVRPRTVLGIVGQPMTGVSYIRFFQPFQHLEPYGYRLATLGDSLRLVRTERGHEPAPSLVEGAAMVMFPQMVASPELPDGSRVSLVEPVCDLARENGIPIVYSVDDYLGAIEQHNPGFETITDSIDNLRTILERADALVVTTPELHRTLAKTGKPVHRVPNAVDPSRWKPRPRASRLPRIGWTGSSSHLEDLRMVVPAIRKLQRKVRCDFVLQGLVSNPLPAEAENVRRIRADLPPSKKATADAFLDLVELLESIDCIHVPFASVERFFDLLPRLDLDIGICPLLDTEFNRHKSANKFYEYAVTGSLTVASRVTPYTDETSITVPDDPDQWCDVLEHYLRRPEEREAELERQRAFVLAERNIETVRELWAETLGEILARAATPCGAEG